MALPRFEYLCQGEWRGSPHTFYIGASHSGSAFGPTDAQTFMEGASSPYALSYAPFQSNGITVIGSRYYGNGTGTVTWEAAYGEDNPTPPNLVPTGAAYGTEGVQYLPLEVCVLLEAPVGTNSRGKPDFLRKFIRGAPLDGYGTGANRNPQWAFVAAAQTAAQSQGNGSWYENRVYCSASGKQATSTGWSASSQPSNHQVPRGRKRKVSTSTANTAVNVIRTIVADGHS